MDQTPTAATPATSLGIPGYTFGDLHDPDRLASLYDRFCEEVQASDPDLWHEWDAYRKDPDAPRPPIALSNLIVAMAPQVSRFLTGLFEIGAEASAIAAATRNQDDLFRFKVDFVRRRVLPLLKGGAHVEASPEDEAIVARLSRGNAESADHSLGERKSDGAQRSLRAPRPLVDSDLELRIARAGCALLDREKAEKDAVAAQIEALDDGARRTSRSGLQPLGDLPLSRKTSSRAIRNRS